MSSRRAIDAAQARAMGTRIKEMRGGATQAEFASKLGIDRASLANYESGKRIPNNVILKKLGDISGKSVPEILFGTYKTPYEKYLSAINDTIALRMRERPGVIPKFMISDDELALITVVRLAFQNKLDTRPLCDLLELAQEVIATDEHVGVPPYGEDAVERFKVALARGWLEEGYDPDAFFYATLWEGADEGGMS